MGNKDSVSISDVLFSGGQQRVLGLLFGQPDRSFYANEIAKLALTGRGALQREQAEGMPEGNWLSCEGNNALARMRRVAVT